MIYFYLVVWTFIKKIDPVFIEEKNLNILCTVTVNTSVIALFTSYAFNVLIWFTLKTLWITLNEEKEGIWNRFVKVPQSDTIPD
jgi:hypothetical protein